MHALGEEQRVHAAGEEEEQRDGCREEEQRDCCKSRGSGLLREGEDQEGDHEGVVLEQLALEVSYCFLIYIYRKFVEKTQKSF